jgi:glutaredoxin-related protein
MTCNLQILRRAHRRLGACRVAGRVGCCHLNVCNQRGGLRCVQWPTFPQVYIGGEFFGGCDILLGVFEGASNRSTWRMWKSPTMWVTI